MILLGQYKLYKPTANILINGGLSNISGLERGCGQARPALIHHLHRAAESVDQTEPEDKGGPGVSTRTQNRPDHR